jgi:hypothetical protein
VKYFLEWLERDLNAWTFIGTLAIALSFVLALVEVIK